MLYVNLFSDAKDEGLRDSMNLAHLFCNVVYILSTFLSIDPLQLTLK